MRGRITAVGLLWATAVAAGAQEPVRDAPAWVRVDLKNGRSLHGRLLHADKSWVTLRLEFGEVHLAAADVTAAVEEEAQPRVETRLTPEPGKPDEARKLDGPPCVVRPAPSKELPRSVGPAVSDPPPAGRADAILRACGWATPEAQDRLVRELAALGRPAAAECAALAEQYAAQDDIGPAVPLIRALGEAADRTAVAPLARLLGAVSFEVRRAAVRSLARFREPAVIAVLADALGDRDLEVVQVASQTLEAFAKTDSSQMVRQSLRRVLAGSPAHTRNAGCCLLGIDEADAIRLLVDLLQAPDAGIRMAAMQVLATGGPAWIAERLRGALWDGDEQVVKEACVACGMRKDPDAVDRLVELAASPLESVARNAQWALRAITGEDFTDPALWEAWRGANRRR